MPIVIFGKDDGRVCLDCGKAPPLDVEWCGPRMWFQRYWTCRHPKTLTCPECMKKDSTKQCPVCNCGEEYT